MMTGRIMSTKQQLVIIAVAALLVSVSLTNIVSAATTPTTLTIATSTTNPAVSPSFNLKGTLKAGTTTLSGKTITLLRQAQSGQWSAAGTNTTDTNGHYTIKRSESELGIYHYYVHFGGDTTHSASSSPTVVVTVGTLPSTTLTITTSTTNPAVSQSFTLKGTLKAGTTPLSGKTITLLRQDLSGQWSAAGTNTTDTNGNYTIKRSESELGIYHYYVHFGGDTTHTASSSPTVVVKIGRASC